MSKMGNYRLAVQESEDYRFGWESAERGEPAPSWLAPFPDQQERRKVQQLGWSDYHNQERQP